MEKPQRDALLAKHSSNMGQLRDMRAGSLLGAKVSGRSLELPTNPGRVGRATLGEDNARIRAVLGRQFS